MVADAAAIGSEKLIRRGFAGITPIELGATQVFVQRLKKITPGSGIVGYRRVITLVITLLLRAIFRQKATA